MNIENKLSYKVNWNKEHATFCWQRFNQLYDTKHQTALFHSINIGELDKYIEKKCLTFRRYAKMFVHKTNNYSYEWSINDSKYR